MIAMKFDKRFFFDRKAVEDIVGKQAAKALGRAGAFVQRRARSSLRRRRKVSSPGQPPSVHSKDKVATLKNIQFQFSPKTMSVLVGPLLLNGSREAVPGIHERGGSRRVREVLVGKQWREVGRRHPKPKQPVRIRTAQYPERPFMGPALAKEAPKFPTLFGRSA